MSQRQLYSLVRDTKRVAHSYKNRETNAYLPIYELVPATFIVRWPNGAPCIFVEWFLSEISIHVTVRRNDGGSLKVFASDLSHLIRFCWEYQIDFKDMQDSHFNDYIEVLIDNSGKRGTECLRRSRTVRRIIDNSIKFLQWLQENILVGQKIVGPVNSGAQIRVKEFSGGPAYVSCKLTHPLKPPNDAQDLKGPIATSIKLMLWDTVAKISQVSFYSARYLARFSSEIELTQELRYLSARRELLLFLLEATGARPGELARLLVEPNESCAIDSKIHIPTLKRRNKNLVMRLVPVDRGVAIKLEVFIKRYRAELLVSLKERGINAQTNGCVFLCSRKGTAISEASLTREFHRIVTVANIEQRTCMSMFRHAYITKIVASYLKEFMDKNTGKIRALFTESDYLAILKKVTKLTGHGSERSLLHYIDLAWDEIGIYDPAEANVKLEANLNSTLSQLDSLARQLRSVEHPNVLVTVEELADELQKIRQRTIRSRTGDS